MTVTYISQNIGNVSATIKLTDLSGRVIQSQNLSLEQGKNIIELNTMNLSPGMYFLEIDNGGEKQVAKFAKQ